MSFVCLAAVSAVAAAATAALGVAAPACVLGIPFRRFPQGALRTFAGVLAGTAFAAAFATGIAAASAGAGVLRSAALASAAAAVTGLALGGRALSRLTPVRRIRLLGASLRDERARGPALRALQDLAARPGPPQEQATRALHVVAVLAEAGLWDDAHDIARRCPEDPGTDGLRAVRAVSLANSLLFLGARPEARRILAAVPRPAPHPVTESALGLTEALLLALEGDPDDALARASALDTHGDTGLERARLVVKTQATAARGRRIEAERLLDVLRARHGESALERVRRLEGPASPLAAALLRGRETPYR